MDRVVEAVGRKSDCTYCGVLLQQGLGRGADIAGVDKIATGDNAGDVTETALLIVLRGDMNRHGRCMGIITGGGGARSALPRREPLKYIYEKEIVMYGHC